MKSFLIAGSVVAVAVFVLIAWIRTSQSPQQTMLTPTPSGNQTEAIELRSSAFDAGGAIPVKYTCDAENMRPPLSISGVSKGTQSLAIVMYDPDAPGGTFVHWVAWNIPPETKELAEGSLPAGVMEGTNSFRTVGYRGPCPPNGTHRYIWRLYALRTILTLDKSTTRERLETAINTYVIAQTELMARYTKQ